MSSGDLVAVLQTALRTSSTVTRPKSASNGPEYDL